MASSGVRAAVLGLGVCLTVAVMGGSVSACPGAVDALACAETEEGNLLAWRNNAEYTQIVIVRNGESIDVPFSFECAAEVGGFQFGVLHDEERLDIFDVYPSPSLEAAVGEVPFFGANLSPGADPGDAGFTVGVLIDFLELVYLPADREQEVVIAFYEILDEGPAVLGLEITGRLGNPAVVPSVWIDRTPADLGISVTDLEDGSVIVSNPRFLRGDINEVEAVGLADVIVLLERMFISGLLECRRAADFDDDAVLTIADPIGLLTHFFAEGPAPEAPYPACGVVAPGGLSCVAYCGCEP